MSFIQKKVIDYLKKMELSGADCLVGRFANMEFI